MIQFMLCIDKFSNEEIPITIEDIANGLKLTTDGISDLCEAMEYYTIAEKRDDAYLIKGYNERKPQQKIKANNK